VKKFILVNRSETSGALGVGLGFINFSALYSWNISWEISFVIAIVSGFLFSYVLEIFLGKELDKHEAEKISNAVSDFEDRSKD
tara:strand:+ start:469 stop:717 length:249 start_codon:yes stop_codon:yes gene_type:complete